MTPFTKNICKKADAASTCFHQQLYVLNTAQVSSRAAAVNASFTLGNTESILALLRPLFIK